MSISMLIKRSGWFNEHSQYRRQKAAKNDWGAKFWRCQQFCGALVTPLLMNPPSVDDQYDFESIVMLQQGICPSGQLAQYLTTPDRRLNCRCNLGNCHLTALYRWSRADQWNQHDDEASLHYIQLLDTSLYATIMFLCISSTPDLTSFPPEMPRLFERRLYTI